MMVRNVVDRLQLASGDWEILDRIGDPGGYGEVFEALASDGTRVAVKLIPKGPGVDREPEFAELSARSVVPVLAVGETETHVVIVMPKAEKSLAAFLKERGEPLPVADAIAILMDIAQSLSDLATAGIVHRDLKPANVLLLDDRWCLADFGISRFAGAATAKLTWKGGGTSEYKAPEVWMYERATSASDVYSFGATAFEVLSGKPPFLGPDFREQHVGEAPPNLPGLPPLLASLIAGCLSKSPEARPTPAEILTRLTKAAAPAASGGLAALSEANREHAVQLAEIGQQASRRDAAQERWMRLFGDAENSLLQISEEFAQQLAEHAPDGKLTRFGPGEWVFELGVVKLGFSSPRGAIYDWGTGTPPFDVVAYATVVLRVPDYHPGPHPAFARPNTVSAHGYKGRSHSLWYCNAQATGRFRWFETAFMTSPDVVVHPSVEPFALTPNAEARRAFETAEVHQVAWPFTPLEPGDIGPFIGQWATWLAEAAQGRLTFPVQLPVPLPARAGRKDAGGFREQ
ncbi:serine/threonine-protein kinase [Kitasatospora sp. NPDC127111]|uniref:serine/threonine-protein kinase n=1 Tax=Kitasatospora sp. NPDC127111 TaxID=3345363 RepID=UPI003638F491